jgi:acetyl-CoA C-acetyltransferase
LLNRLDSLDVVNVISWPYDNLPDLLSDRIGAAPRWRRHGEIGGHTPIQFMHEAAARIAGGQAAIAAVCGGEASHTATWARRTGAALDWTRPRAEVQTGTDRLPARNRDCINPLARQHGLTEPIAVHPLYENATQAAWGQTPSQAQSESAALWASLSEVAAGNPTAWLRTPCTAASIAAIGPANRPVAWPHPKLMVANPAVNMAAAVLLTSLAVARAAGIPDDRLVFLHAGAAAVEPRDWMARPHLDACPAQEAVLEAMLRASDGEPPSLCELCTCFPVVPKMARRVFGLPDSTPISVTGGLTFHGAPFDSTMLHAAAMMVRHLRVDGGRGLLYGQGGHLTAHHGLLLGRDAAPADAMLRPFDCNAEAVARRPAPPLVATDATGTATLETFTIVFNPDGSVAHGRGAPPARRRPHAGPGAARRRRDAGSADGERRDLHRPYGAPGAWFRRAVILGGLIRACSFARRGAHSERRDGCNEGKIEHPVHSPSGAWIRRRSPPSLIGVRLSARCGAILKRAAGEGWLVSLGPAA